MEITVLNSLKTNYFLLFFTQVVMLLGFILIPKCKIKHRKIMESCMYHDTDEGKLWCDDASKLILYYICNALIV